MLTTVKSMAGNRSTGRTSANHDTLTRSEGGCRSSRNIPAPLLVLPLALTLFAATPASATEWGCMFAKRSGTPDQIERYCRATSGAPSRFLHPSASAGAQVSRPSPARDVACADRQLPDMGKDNPCTSRRGS